MGLSTISHNMLNSVCHKCSMMHNTLHNILGTQFVCHCKHLQIFYRFYNGETKLETIEIFTPLGLKNHIRHNYISLKVLLELATSQIMNFQIPILVWKGPKVSIDTQKLRREHFY